MSNQSLVVVFFFFSFFLSLLLSEWPIFYHKVFWSNSLQELKLSRLGKHSLRNGKVLFVIILSDLVLGRGKVAVSLRQHHAKQWYSSTHLKEPLWRL